MQTKNYNLIPLSIDQGLNRVPIGTAGGYIRLLEAPAAANVQIHLNEQNADGIPLKTYHAIEATNIEKIFVSCNAVPGEKITVVQANTAKDFKMVTPASDVKLSSLGSYESVALDQLDKIINPYSLPTHSNDRYNTSSTLTTVLSKTLDCDKIDIYLFAKHADEHGDFLGQHFAKLDGVEVCLATGYSSSNGRSLTNNDRTTIENVRGKKIEICVIDTTSDNRICGYLLSEYNLK